MKNMYPGAGYLDNCGWIADLPFYKGWADQGALFAVFTSQSKDRDSGTGTWIVVSAESKSAGSSVLEKDRILLQNTFVGPWRDGTGSPRPAFLDGSDRLPSLVPEFKISGSGLQVFLSDNPKRHNNSSTWSILFSESDFSESDAGIR